MDIHIPLWIFRSLLAIVLLCFFAWAYTKTKENQVANWTLNAVTLLLIWFAFYSTLALIR